LDCLPFRRHAPSAKQFEFNLFVRHRRFAPEIDRLWIRSRESSPNPWPQLRKLRFLRLELFRKPRSPFIDLLRPSEEHVQALSLRKQSTHGEPGQIGILSAERQLDVLVERGDLSLQTLSVCGKPPTLLVDRIDSGPLLGHFELCFTEMLLQQKRSLFQLVHDPVRIRAHDSSDPFKDLHDVVPFDSFVLDSSVLDSSALCD
jgi:hypothetical protein